MGKPFLNFARPREAAAATLGLLICLSAGAQDDTNFDIAGLQAIRGTVSKVEGSSVYVKSPGGSVYQVETGPNTHFVKEGAQSPNDPAKAGDTVLAGGELDQKKRTLGAVFVAVVDAKQLAELDRRRAEWGKTWLAGTITAKSGTQLKVKRPDGQVDTVAVDEDTSFRKNHQSIVYPEVVPGDGMTARGEKKGDVFIAKVLTVVDAAEIRAWSRLKDGQK